MSQFRENLREKKLQAANKRKEFIGIPMNIGLESAEIGDELFRYEHAFPGQIQHLKVDLSGLKRDKVVEIGVMVDSPRTRNSVQRWNKAINGRNNIGSFNLDPRGTLVIALRGDEGVVRDVSISYTYVYQQI